mgnify:FL=1|jgi:hypothetical protein|tara:strand:+ start:108 stop:344 length:237 start_codon:yes stop_codon:yes gene_type:complete
MTYVYQKRIYNGGVTDSPTIVKVEYVLSSLTNLIKVVDMWVDGKFHRLNWMSKEGQADLMDELEKDYLLNYSVIKKVG